MEELLAERADLRGLPLRAGTSCQTSKEQIRILAQTSARVRRMQNPERLSKEEEAALCAWLAALGKSIAYDEDAPLYVRPLGGDSIKLPCHSS
jgi:hypothetical protein